MHYRRNLDKIGNTIIYLSDRLKPLYLTKAIKLLYLIDENSVKETGVPFTWLDYNAWRMGPVPEDIYFTLRNKDSHYFETSDILTYVSINKDENSDIESFRIDPLKSFEDHEFSEYDIELMDRIIAKYGNFSGKELIDKLHEEGSLWDRVVKQNNLELQFLLMNNRSDQVIPFLDLIADSELKQLSYKSAYSSLLFDSQFA